MKILKEERLTSETVAICTEVFLSGTTVIWNIFGLPSSLSCF